MERTSQTGCPHRNFHADVTVNRLEDAGQFQCEVRVECQDCGTPFRFLGLPRGLNLHGAACSPDGLEARLAIAPGPGLIPPGGTLTYGVGG